MASLDFISTAVIQSELKSLVGNKGNGLIKKWMEYQPGMLEHYITNYGLNAAIEGLIEAYTVYGTPNLSQIRNTIENKIKASGEI